MHYRLTPTTALMLLVPPLMWAGNAIIGRMVAGMVPPMMFNLLRWALAFALLLPLAWRVLLPGSGLWSHWGRFSALGLLSVGAYNSLQYLALRTSSPINVTLVAASMPIWMLLFGRLFFQVAISPRQLLGAGLSMSGVLLVLSRGQPWSLLQIQLVPGDFYMLLATIVWAFYSWMLTRPGKEPLAIRGDWAAFLMAQIVFGLFWSALFSVGEWSMEAAPVIWSLPLLGVLLFVAVGPALLAYRCWGTGVQRAGPTVASFFGNLTPLFAAVMSTLLLGETPQGFHFVAFLLIVGGIVVSSRR